VTGQREPGLGPRALVWRAAEHRRMSWRNGGGVTYEVTTDPAGAGLEEFDWRISFAEVSASGPFSSYPGVDRILVLLQGESMRLRVDGTSHDLSCYQPVRFSGDSATYGELTCGPTRDLNVMTRRGRVDATVDIIALTARTPTESGSAPVLVLLSLTAPVEVGAQAGPVATLEPWDGLRWAGATPLDLSGTGVVAAVRLHPR